MKGKRAIYGVGLNCKILEKYIGIDEEYEYDYLDQIKFGTEYRDKIVKDPDKEDYTEYENIIITPRKSSVVFDWLRDNKKISTEKLISPHGLNRDYVSKTIEKSKIIFFDNPEVDCFRFLFDEMIEQNRIKLMCLLRDDDKWIIDRRIEGDYFFVFGGYDIVEYFDNGFFEYIKQTYYESKMAIILWDKWDGVCGFKENIPSYITPELVRKTFDYSITYHTKDAEKYGFDYFPQFYPNQNYQINNNLETDLFFVGNAKTPKRLRLIHNIYRLFSDAGYICSFYVRGVEKSDQLQGSDIIYNMSLNYDEIVSGILKSRAILEVCVEGDQTSYRLSEAIIFGKKLIVNDANVVKSKYYNSSNVLVYETVDDIDVGWLERESIDYQYQGDLDTTRFIEDLMRR